MPASIIKPFIEAVEHADERLTQLSREGTKIIGYFCTYTPVELIHAAGLLPVRVLGGQGPVKHADALLPAFACPYMRLALDKRLAGNGGYLSGIVQGYTCDVACGAVRIWQENIPGEIYHILPLPYNDNPDSRRYFRAALTELSDKLNAIGGAFSEEKLHASIRLYEDIRSDLHEMYRLRAENRLNLSAADMLTVVLAGCVMRPEEYRQMVHELLERLSIMHDARPGIPVLVSGSVLEGATVLDAIEASGGRIAADDLCTGLRSTQPLEGLSSDPMERLIDRTFRRIPCPSRSRAEERTARLLGLINQSNARGVVFLLQKFCTPHLADIPALVAGLSEAAMQSTVIEMDEAGTNIGGLKTRVEAFFEMLGA